MLWLKYAEAGWELGPGALVLDIEGGLTRGLGTCARYLSDLGVRFCAPGRGLASGRPEPSQRLEIFQPLWSRDNILRPGWELGPGALALDDIILSDTLAETVGPPL